MTIKTTFAALALILSPAMVFADCSGKDTMQDASISCAVGTSYDAKTGTCIPGTSS
ncbi:MAG: adenylosuccinate lyase [Rhodobacteraceae bacterium]|jgi:hypothetical protein|nr:adenylosuccinate lyase [Paracoccaceae bacterium]